MRINERSRLIRPESPLEPKYPVYIEDARNEYRNVSFSSTQEEEQMVPFGYYPVLDVEIPTGDVVTEAFPVKGEDGKWRRAYDVRDFTQEELDEKLRQAKSEAVMHADYEGQSIQGRNVEVEIDKKKYPFSLSIQSRQVLGELVLLAYMDTELSGFTVRTANNVNLELTREQLFEVTKTVIGETHRLQEAVYEYIDLIEVVTEIEDMPEPFVLPA